jgi:hypothetical protein
VAKLDLYTRLFTWAKSDEMVPILIMRDVWCAPCDCASPRSWLHPPPPRLHLFSVSAGPSNKGKQRRRHRKME